ncbi:hypothetical protein ABIF43_006354 [Bradyrhizobium japonicum]
MITCTRPLQKLVGLVRQMLAHAVGAGDGGLVDMDTRRRLTRATIANIRGALDALAHGMVEDQDAIGLQRGTQERLDRGIVDRAYFLVVVKILHLGRMAHQRKAFAVERDIVRDQPRVEDRHLMRLRQRRALRLARRRIERVGARLA